MWLLSLNGVCSRSGGEEAISAFHSETTAGSDFVCTCCHPMMCMSGGEEAISAFHSETTAGSDFVCTCCHPMMYRKSVVQCKKAKYTKASPNLLYSSHTPHVNIERVWLSQITMSVQSNAVLHTQGLIGT